MGRGNVCVTGRYEGLYYIDYVDTEVYRRKSGDPEDEDGYKMLRDLGYDELTGGEWERDDLQSETMYDDVIENFACTFMARFRSFTRCNKWIRSGCNYRRAILENELFYICTEDNEWSMAVELVQKEEPYGEPWMENLQGRHFQKYLDGVLRALLEFLPSVGTRRGAWMAGTITREEVA